MNSVISVPSTPVLQLMDTFSVTVWVYAEDTNRGEFVQGALGPQFAIGLRGGGSVLHCVSSKYCSDQWLKWQVDGQQTISAGSWFHAAFVVQATDASVYQNGIFDAEGVRPTPVIEMPTGLKIGNNCDSSAPFFGRIDEVRVTTRALSPGWLRTEVNNQSAPQSFYVLSAEERRP
jgi:hypothetical protein